MLGLMQQKNLLLSSIIQHAARWHPNADIVSRASETTLHRSDYATIERRSRRLADVLQRLGVNQGDRVATMAWNGTMRYTLSDVGSLGQTFTLDWQARADPQPKGVCPFEQTP